MKQRRYAIVTGGLGADLETVQSYLPSNYSAFQAVPQAPIMIEGRDSHGWTLEGYVIPRLQTALIVVEEVQS